MTKYDVKITTNNEFEGCGVESFNSSNSEDLHEPIVSVTDEFKKVRVDDGSVWLDAKPKDVKSHLKEQGYEIIEK